MTGLQHIQRPSHIPLTQLDQALHRLRLYIDLLLLDDLIHQHPDIPLLQRGEPEPRTPREQGLGELVRVVGDDAEAGVGRVFLHDPTQRHLRRRGHGVCLVEDDELEVRDRRGVALLDGEDLFRALSVRISYPSL